MVSATRALHSSIKVINGARDCVTLARAYWYFRVFALFLSCLVAQS